MIGAIGDALLELGFDEPAPDAAPPSGYGCDAATRRVMDARGGARLCGRVGDDPLAG